MKLLPAGRPGTLLAVWLFPAIGLLGSDDGRLINLSTRGQIGSGDGILIGGFVIDTGEEATVLIRAVGPSLAADPISLQGVAVDPVLTVFSAEGAVLAQNDDWNSNDGAAISLVGAFHLQPGSKDAALVLSLPPGAYTAHVTAKDAGSDDDLVLLEIYEVGTSGARLLNLSTRGRVGRDAGVMIPGFWMATGTEPRRLLVRASGESLRNFGVADTLTDPVLRVVRVDGTVLATNDDWGTPASVQSAGANELSAAFKRAGAFDFPLGSRDAALLVEFPAGGHTIHVSGAGDSTGVALVEMFDLSGPVRPIVGVAATTPMGEESGLERTGFAVTRTGDLNSPLTVRYRVDGTATAETDYTALPGMVTLPAGVDRVEIPVTAREDMASEGAESVTIALSPDEAYDRGLATTATAWVADGLNTFLESVRARHGLPGMAAVVFDSERVIAIGAAGTRKVGSGVPLLHTDRLQIASISKSITATVVAKLVETGQLSWESTLAQLFPELAAAMEPRYRSVTVDMMLRHLGGFPQWMRNSTVVEDWTRRYRHLDNRGTRFEAVKYIVTHRTLYTPGTVHYYTNDSFLILGSVCERAAGMPWEELLAKTIFEPLGMRSSGFGDPANDRSLNNPWGHVREGGQYVPADPAPEAFGYVPFGSAYGSILHASVGDLAKYGIFHLRGDFGLETGLSFATFRRLHHAPLTSLQPLPERFGAGFFNEGELRPDGRWTNVQHWGYYGSGRTLFWFSPQANVGAAILINGTDEDAVPGMRPISEAVIELFRRYRSTPPAAAADG